MELDEGLEEGPDGRGRLTRILLASALAVVAIASFRKGKRLAGALTAAGAVALGYTTVSDATDSIESSETDGLQTEEHTIETTSHNGRMRCGICGEDITVGQSRGPDANHETVHDDCLEAQ